MIWANVKAANNNVKTVQEHVKNGYPVDKSSAQVNCLVGDSNPSPHTSITAKVMSGVETPSKSTSSPTCVGSDACIARIRQSSRSHIRDLNPNLSTNIVEVECNTKVQNVNTSSELVVNDESLVTNVEAGLNESGSSRGPLTNPATEVVSRPSGRDPLPSGYTGQCGSTSNSGNHITAKVTTLGEGGQHVDVTCVGSDNGSSVNTGYQKVSQRWENTNCLIFDINQSGIEDKFVNSILHARHAIDVNKFPNVDSDIFHKWRRQSAFNFGFVPLGSQLMPQVDHINDGAELTPIEMHFAVRKTNKPNFMLARIPVKGQLNVEAWCEHLKEYWDQQLLQLIRYGCPLDFNRACNIKSESGNHKSAVDYPTDIEAYIAEEQKYDAILGPYKQKPIEVGHSSPFMTRAKPNSDRHRVIIDLSWPLGASVNTGIDKNAYIDAPFALTFPSVDDITNELKSLGRGAFLYKIDVSCAFRHVKVDPGDYNLLGLEWNGHYVDTCVPFGTRHGSQIFQRLSNAVRFVMRREGFTMIDYIDDYVGMGVPSYPP